MPNPFRSSLYPSLKCAQNWLQVLVPFSLEKAMTEVKAWYDSSNILKFFELLKYIIVHCVWKLIYCSILFIYLFIILAFYLFFFVAYNVSSLQKTGYKCSSKLGYSHVFQKCSFRLGSIATFLKTQL